MPGAGAGCLTATAGVLLLAWCWCSPAPVPRDAALTEARAACRRLRHDPRCALRPGRRSLKQACPPAPEGACQALRVVSLWWQISINPESRALDRRFDDLAAATIAANEAWTRREPQRAEAWFYLAGAYAPRVQWRVLRGERLGAARDGKRIKDALERALQLDPTLNDAYFGIGLYHYYADVAPAAAKVLRWLLFLPGGDRVTGLREMLQARDKRRTAQRRSRLPAALRLSLVRAQDRGGARRCSTQLDARYPNNPLFLQLIAEIRDTYLHDHAAQRRRMAIAARTRDRRQRLRRASDGSPRAPRPCIGARRDESLADAIAELQHVVDMHPIEPIGARERAERELRAAIARVAVIARSRRNFF